MKILIIGPGALGCVFAKKLQSSFTVRLYGPRPPRGAELLSLWEPTAPDELNSPALILLTCKVPQIDEIILQELKPLIQKTPRHVLDQSMILALQNGLGIQSLIEASQIPLPSCRGVAWFGARWENGRLQESASPLRMTIAHQSHTITERIRQVLMKSGFAVEVLEGNLSSELLEWKKAFTSLALNPVLTLARAPNGALLESSDLQTQARQLQQEAFLIFQKLGLSGITPLEAWSDLIRTCEDTALNRNSMLQDLEFGRKLELDWLNGWILKKAHELGISLPHHEKIVAKLKQY